MNTTKEELVEQVKQLKAEVAVRDTMLAVLREINMRNQMCIIAHIQNKPLPGPVDVPSGGVIQGIKWER